MKTSENMWNAKVAWSHTLVILLKGKPWISNRVPHCVADIKVHLWTYALQCYILFWNRVYLDWLLGFAGIQHRLLIQFQAKRSICLTNQVEQYLRTGSWGCPLASTCHMIHPPHACAPTIICTCIPCTDTFIYTFGECSF